MRILFLGSWTLLLVGAHVLFAEAIAWGRAAPDFLVLLPAFVALYAPRTEAVKVALGAGLVGDVLFSARLGPMMLSLAAACLTLASVRPWRTRVDILTAAAAAGCTALGAQLLYALTRVAGWSGPPVASPLTLALGIAAYTFVAALVIFPALEFSAIRLGYPPQCATLHQAARDDLDAGPTGYPISAAQKK